MINGSNFDSRWMSANFDPRWLPSQTSIKDERLCKIWLKMIDWKWLKTLIQYDWLCKPCDVVMELDLTTIKLSTRILDVISLGLKTIDWIKHVPKHGLILVGIFYHIHRFVLTEILYIINCLSLSNDIYQGTDFLLMTFFRNGIYAFMHQRVIYVNHDCGIVEM